MARELLRLRPPFLEPDRADGGRELDLKVVFTDLVRTSAALKTAREMARGLGARITVVIAQVVPYPLPLADPPVPIQFTERMVESMADDNTAFEIYLCRDRNETIRRALPPDSVVIVGSRMRSWFSWERALARVLRHDGRRVLVVAL